MQDDSASVEGFQEPPVYQIDLDLPPRDRFQNICAIYKDEIVKLEVLYHEILEMTPFPRALDFLGKHLMKRVFSEEETEEMRGISEACEVDMHLVVAYNTFLDVLSGCMSGGVKLSATPGKRPRIVHFRGLDWYMDALRPLTVIIEYTRAGDVIARSITYAGYIGILTGVRQGLSVSLNYRGEISWRITSVIKQLFHDLLLLMGRRPSNSSFLRKFLLDPEVPSLARIAEDFTKIRSSPAYFIFTTPEEVMVLEKKRKGVTVQSSEEFLAVTNHDLAVENWGEEAWKKAINKTDGIMESDKYKSIGVREIMDDSIERKRCLVAQYEELTRKSSQKTRRRLPNLDNVKDWMSKTPVLNSQTHFSCIMDSSMAGGGILWVRKYDEGFLSEDDFSVSDWDDNDTLPST